MQTTKEVHPHPCIVPCVNIWSFFFFFFFCHLLNIGACICHIAGKAKWSGPHHTNIKMSHFVLFHSVTCYTKSIVSHIHVNTTKLRNITCTSVATGVILRSVECILVPSFPEDTLSATRGKVDGPCRNGVHPSVHPLSSIHVGFPQRLSGWKMDWTVHGPGARAA